jgi:hypothetical protein
MIEDINVLIKPKVVREQIAVLAVLTDVDPFMVLEHALEDGLIRKEKEEDRYSFAVNIDTFLNAFSRSHVEE